MNMKIFLIATITLLSSLNAMAADQLVPTELWITGDDGLTRQFTKSLRTALAKSKILVPSGSTSKDGMVITIPRNLYWQEVNGNTNFEYVVIFTDRSSKYLGVSIGSCWEKGIDECASTVIEAAERAWADRSRDGA